MKKLSDPTGKKSHAKVSWEKADAKLKAKKKARAAKAKAKAKEESS